MVSKNKKYDIPNEILNFLVDQLSRFENFHLLISFSRPYMIFHFAEPLLYIKIIFYKSTRHVQIKSWVTSPVPSPVPILVLNFESRLDSRPWENQDQTQDLFWKKNFGGLDSSLDLEFKTKVKTYFQSGFSLDESKNINIGIHGPIRI